MRATLRFRSLLSSSTSPSSFPFLQPCKHGLLGLNLTASASSTSNRGLLDLQEIQNVLTDVRADNVKVIPVPKNRDWADFMVLATGRSTWHVKNIAQALIYKAKQKQKGAARLVLPSVEGDEGGKWIVIDAGEVIVHALDEKAREYYNLEDLWTTEISQKESDQELGKASVKVRPKNNSKKPAQKIASSGGFLYVMEFVLLHSVVFLFYIREPYTHVVLYTKRSSLLSNQEVLWSLSCGLCLA